MIRLFLRGANAPLFALLVMLAVAVQTSLFARSPLSYLEPDVILLAVIWCGLRRSFLEGGILTLLFADIAEIHSAAPQGVLLILYMVVFQISRVAIKVLDLSRLTTLVIFTLLASVVWKLLYWLVMDLLGASGGYWEHTVIFMFPTAAVAGVFGLWAYPALDRFDRMTFKSPRLQTTLEEELQLEGEGF